MTKMDDDEIYNDVFYSQEDEQVPPAKPPRTLAYEADHFKLKPPQKPPRSVRRTDDSIPDEVTLIMPSSQN